MVKGEEKWVDAVHSEGVISVAVGGGYVVSRSGDERVRSLEVESGVQLWKDAGHSGAVMSVAVSEGYVVSGSADETRSHPGRVGRERMSRWTPHHYNKQSLSSWDRYYS